MAISTVELVLIALLNFLLISVYSYSPECQDQGFTFTKQPQDIEIDCGEHEVVHFSCQHEGHELWKLRPQWIINSQVYSPHSLPPGHTIDGNGLNVTITSLTQNNSIYRCQVVHSLFHDEPICAHRSTFGRLVINCKVPQLHFIPHYHYQSLNLKKINTFIQQIPSDTDTYNVLYTTTSGTVCDNVTIISSSCLGGSCSHVLNVATPSCLCSDITVEIRNVTRSGFTYLIHEPVILDAVNNIVHLSLNKTASDIKIEFIKQPKESDKYLKVAYGKNVMDCNELPHELNNRVADTNMVSLKIPNTTFDDESDNISFCFTATTHGSSINFPIETLVIEGIYHDNIKTCRSTITSPAKTFAVIISCRILLCVLALLTILILLIFYNMYVKRHQGKSTSDKITGENITDNDDTNVQELKKKNLKIVDPSTTFCIPFDVERGKTTYDVICGQYPNYRAEEGFGYYPVSPEELKKLDAHKKVILVQKKRTQKMGAKHPKPVYAGYISAAVEKDNINDYEVFVQDKSYNRKFDSDKKILFCTRSKEFPAYTKIEEIKTGCKQIDFLKKCSQQLKAEWSRYGYYEFTGTSQEHILPDQRIIVMKMDGKLMTGPGIRYIIGATGDGSKLTAAPDLSHHKYSSLGWKHVFVQSKTIERILPGGTKYLFCANLDKVPRRECKVYTVKEETKMVTFGKHNIPAFKLELGYGYFQLTDDDEDIKAHKRVILMDKKKNMFTGAGAQFYCADKQKLGEQNSSPTTDWECIFVQSHSDERVLKRNTKLLYCYYVSYKK